MESDDRVRFRKPCDCPSGAVTTETRSYIHHTQLGSEVLMPAVDRPVCLKCGKEWEKVI